MNDRPYRLSLTFAFALHAVLVLLLLVKITSSYPPTLNKVNVINAVVINESDSNNQINKSSSIPKKENAVTKNLSKKQIPKQQPSVIIKKPQPKDQIEHALQKDILEKQANELAELRKERLIYKKTAAKMQQQIQKTLHDQAIAEQQILHNQIMEQKQLADEQMQANSGGQSQGEEDKYIMMIKQAISSQWIKPDGVAKHAKGKILINIAPGGIVLNVQILISSGSSVLDRSAQAAVLKASPLPVPEDHELFDKFRTMELNINPEGVVIK